MTRYVMDAGEHDGWHGEDTMTMLAYYALLELEKFYDMQLNILNTTPLAKVILPIKEAP